MAEAKSDFFSEEERELAEFAKALAHPARIKILQLLNSMDVCMVGDMVELLPLSQSTVSQHLKELKGAGLIIGEVAGPKRCYCLNTEIVQKAKKAIDNLFSKICNC